MEIYFMYFGIFFMIAICVMIYVNHKLMKGADKRLSQANDMVLTLAHSADNLSQSVSKMKEMMCELKEEDSIRIKQIEENRDDFRSAYNALLHQYKSELQKKEEIYNSYISCLRDLAGRPTIQNTNRSSDMR